jgi:hypothetical protein
MPLRELLDDALSDQWAKRSHSGLKLDDEFVLSHVASDYTVTRFVIATERFARGRNDSVGRIQND